MPSKAGVYQIDYSLYYTAGAGSVMALTVGGTEDPSTRLALGAGSTDGTAILPLAAGDVLTLRNVGLTPVIENRSPEIGAQFNIIKLA